MAHRLRNRTFFHVRGLAIKANPSWLILVGLVVYVIAENFIPSVIPEASWLLRWALALLGAAGLFASLLIHELSHSLVARQCGLPVAGITLFVFGGVSELEDEPPSAQAEFLMAAAGPLASIIIGGTLIPLWAIAMALHAPLPLQAVLQYLWMINIFLAAFNLLPAFPMDGGRILRSLLWGASRDQRAATRTAALVGALFGLLLSAFGAWRLMRGEFSGLFPMLVGLFLFRAARASMGMANVRARLSGMTVAQFMSAPPLLVPHGMNLATFVRDFVIPYRLGRFPVVDERGVLVGAVRSDALRNVPVATWSASPVSAVMDPLNAADALDPDASAVELLGALRRRDRVPVIVARDGRPVGTVRVQTFLDYLSMARGRRR